MKATDQGPNFYDRIKRLAGGNGNCSGSGTNGITSKDEMEEERQLQIKFGIASLRYGDPTQDYTTNEEDKRLRSEYLAWYKTCANQVRQKIIDSGNRNFIENIDEAVKDVMDDYIEFCKKLFIEECKHTQTIVNENKIRELNSRTGKITYYDIQWREVSHEQYSAL
jgi:hypothetical protein